MLLHPPRSAAAVSTTQFGFQTPLFHQDVELRSPDTREAGMPQQAPGGVEQGERGCEGFSVRQPTSPRGYCS